MNKAEALALLGVGMPDHWRRADAQNLAQFAEGFVAWLAALETRTALDTDDQLLCRYLGAHANELFAQLAGLHRGHGEFSRNLAQTAAADERQALILDHAARLGASPRELRADRKAFGRWFGADALNDRFRHRIKDTERRLALALRRLGAIAAHILCACDGAEVGGVWSRLDVEASMRDGLALEGSPFVREAAFACLSAAMHALPAAAHETSVSEAMQSFIYRLSLEPRQDTWVQCEAIRLLSFVSPKEFVRVARTRLARTVPGDDLFVRRRIVGLLGTLLQEHPEFADELAVVAQDPSPYVRQQLAATLPLASASHIVALLPPLLLADPVPQVRAAAALQLPALLTQSGVPAADWLLRALDAENDPFVCRVLMHVAERMVGLGLGLDAHLPALDARLQSLCVGAPDLRVRRWAARYAERIWLQTTPQARRLADELRPLLKSCRPGKSVALPASMADVQPALLGRILAVLTQDDHGVELERHRRGWRLWRGHRFHFRLWRWLHEMRHPSPDKRQAFSHTIGRVFRGTLHAPSGILAELAETKVPGEPLHVGAEGDWRSYLPLVDAIISALDEDFGGPPLSIVSAVGTTLVHVPKGLVGRLRARLALTWRFADYARLRNWHEGSQGDPAAYLQALAQLGIRVEFLAHAEGTTNTTARQLDPSVARFFPVPLVAGLPMQDLWLRFDNYFFSVFENSLFELMLFTVAGLVLFVARHLYQNRLIHRARAALPLVVGGWGTRGKSGTERIKAALFNALGYSVVSKTTGCEAMFLHGHSFDQLREMFLFRPYDKATIWEQHNVVRLAAQLKCDVFLWECMALTPAFVRLLQRRWMQDDLATITNTFPDHEDLQGPAGINIPEVMTNFIPAGKTLLTTEEQMRPILQTAADALGTRLRGVGWLESGLLAPDVLARFPYQEHPDNIALVVAMGNELDIAEDFALKEMADRVVADLGVLKTYPRAEIDGRFISFVNGMSANERFGCLGNWTRLGFDHITPQTHPGTLISTVVNNRADRVARSRVFAGILVEDIAADYHFLIGSNLHGLMGYIRESWDAWVAQVSLWPAGHGEPPLTVLANFARRLRIPSTPADVAARRNAISGDGDAANAEYAALLAEYEGFAARLAGGDIPLSKQSALDEEFRQLLWTWFRRKLVVVEDYHATGNQIIALIARHTPPGMENRVMGIQNIKGTGLDFVYRWQAWDTCHRACEDMKSMEAAVANRGISSLAGFQEYGVLCDNHVRATLAGARQSKYFQHERQQAELDIIETNLEAAMVDVRMSLQAQHAASRVERFLAIVEGFLDAGDAVKRRKKADRIYVDLVAERISHSRAAMELQALNKRQKGGWLYAEMKGLLARVAGLFKKK